QSFAALDLDDDGDAGARIRRMPFDTHWNLRRGADLGQLCDDIGARRVGASEARARLHQIVTRGNPFPKWLVVLAYGVYGAVVAARVGGSWLDVLVAGGIWLGARAP